MSVDAIAILHLSASTARQRAPAGARVQPLGRDACAVPLLHAHLGLELHPADAVSLLRQVLGSALGAHDDPRGVLLVPDVVDLPRRGGYEAVVRRVADGGFWVSRALLAAPEADLATRDEHEAEVDFVLRLGGLVTRASDAPGAPVTAVDLHNTRPGPDDVEALCRLGALRSLDLRRVVTLTRGALRSIGRMASLERLALDQLRLGDEDLQLLAGLSSLRFLSLHRTRVAGPGLSALRHLPLRELVLGYTPVDDAGLASVAALPHLEVLRLAPSNVTDAGIARLASCASLRVLDASRTRVTDGVVPTLLGWDRLEQVGLRGTAITPAALGALRGRAGLDVLA